MLGFPLCSFHLLNGSSSKKSRDFDPRGPAGPTAFWKVSDKVTESGGYRALMHDFLPMDQDELGDEYEMGQSEDDEEGSDEEPGLELEITGISLVTWTDD